MPGRRRGQHRRPARSPGRRPGASEAEVFWTDFLRSLADRGLRGVQLVIADDHKGLRAAAARVFNATQQRCRVHWQRNLLAHAKPKQRPAVAAMLKTIFAQESKAEAFEQWNKVADALREKDAKLGELMDAAREDVLAYMDFPKEHWAKISSTNPLERLNKEIKRRTPSRVFLTRAASQSDDPSPDGSSSSASFPTTPPSSASSAPSCSSRPTNGRSAGAI